MENYNKSSDIGRDLIFKFFKYRMKEKGITQNELAKRIDVNVSTLVRNFKKETEMLLSTYLKICGALELNPYLLPKEMDATTMNRIDFN